MKLQLFDYQAQAADLMVTRDRFGLHDEMGIGKTATTIRTCATNEKYFHLIPRPFKLPSSRRLLWREEDIQAWINQATPVGPTRRRRGAPTKAERVAREKEAAHG